MQVFLQRKEDKQCKQQIEIVWHNKNRAPMLLWVAPQHLLGPINKAQIATYKAQRV